MEQVILLGGFIEGSTGNVEESLKEEEFLAWRKGVNRGTRTHKNTAYERVFSGL